MEPSTNIGGIDSTRFTEIPKGVVQDRKAKFEPDSKPGGVRETIGTDGAKERISSGGERPEIPPRSRSFSNIRNVKVSGGTEREQTSENLTTRVRSASLSVFPRQWKKGVVPSSSDSRTVSSKDFVGLAETGLEKSQPAFEEFTRLGGHAKIEEFKGEIKELETSLEGAKRSIRSQMRSIFPGGKLNKLNQQLKIKQAELGQLERLRGQADFHENCFTSISEARLEKGETLRTETPSKFHGDAKILLRNREQLREALIAQIPQSVVDLSRKVGDAQTFDTEDEYLEFNNYVIHLDMHLGVTFDKTTKILHIPGDDQHGELNLEMKYAKVKTLDDGRQILIIGEEIMCDQAKFSTETFGGKVRKAAFNDGCGWGLSAQGAAKKANETALQEMEKGMKKLVENDIVTSRDIIRIHDKAMMAAHEAVVSDEKLGSTCPQIMTVIGDVAHLTLVGDSKCFVISSDLTVRDPTEGIRGGTDATDPGGRIGGKGGKGYVETEDGLDGPDLRNYSHCLIRLNPGDTVVMCSDGIGDNVDPKGMGFKPDDPQFEGIDGSDWDDSNPDHIAARNQFQAKQIKNILTAYKKEIGKEHLTQQDVAKALNRHAQRNALRANAQSGFGNRYHKESGKPDHCGMLVYTHPDD